MIVQLREPKTANDFALYYDLRWRILRKPWTQDEVSSKDEHEHVAFHLMAWSCNILVGVGRVHCNSADEAQIRYLAVEDGYERKNVGSAILEALEVHAWEAGAKYIVLNARENALEFYQKRKYRISGPGNTMFESILHWRMYKDL